MVAITYRQKYISDKRTEWWKRTSWCIEEITTFEDDIDLWLFTEILTYLITDSNVTTKEERNILVLKIINWITQKQEICYGKRTIEEKGQMSEEQMLYLLEMCEKSIEKNSKQSWISKMRDKFCI